MTRIRRIFTDNICGHPSYPCYPCSVLLVVIVCLFATSGFSQSSRQDISLNDNWRTIASTNNEILSPEFYKNSIDDNAWTQVSVPHNWDAYEGYRRLLHGNRHGDSWYRKTFGVNQTKEKKRFFLFFEGVGSYATVYLNEQKVGTHAGGRTTFTIDVTDFIKTDGTGNKLAVRAYHPSGIKDLPWVCGGCSEERGFSEGSQPMGIFRPVHLIITNDIRIEPFGIHGWSEKNKLNIAVSFRNYSKQKRNIVILNQLIDNKGRIVAQRSEPLTLQQNDSITVLQKGILVNNPVLWSVDNPYLYRIISSIKEGNAVIDKAETEFGFRTINWKNPTNQFFLNGKPVFINGVAEYEHLLGQSHAFSKEQVKSRINWVKMAGFNAFRDGHQPHNLLYGQLCDQNGILWWAQLSAHIWYDSPEFRNNFKQLLKEWVIERRNSPSVVLWGLQNESQLPEDFAKECTELIRQLDPTTSSQRLVTTCNGGKGTDWDVPQNWTGTYGGNPDTYASDVKKQVLIGEYGAWRTIDLHTEGGFVQNGILSEDRMTQLMEQKVRLAESVKDSSAGQFFWLLTSHDNPGRVQGGEGKRELDRIGPVNYKGLLTPWEEPLDVFYMFRSNYASRIKEPMVYIVSHTWPDRWTVPGKKDGIVIYSNCDEVELFNDIDSLSLGKRKRKGIGTHFQWDNVDIKYNILYAVGYVNGKAVARDTILLNHLMPPPHMSKLYPQRDTTLKPRPGYHYVYRINCGGPDYTDIHWNQWSADNTANSSSWTADFPGMPAFFGSQRKVSVPIKGTTEWGLFGDFRYGKDKLKYKFKLPAGEYLVELYFIEPWLGVGGGMNAAGMRVFDIAINGDTVVKDLDIWKEAGTNRALKKTVKAYSIRGEMVISFPQSKAGQAIISAIAIASTQKLLPTVTSPSLISNLSDPDNYTLWTWLETGDQLYSDSMINVSSLPSNLYGAEWLRGLKKGPHEPVYFTLLQDADVFVGSDQGGYENTGTEIETSDGAKISVYRKRFSKGTRVELKGPVIIFVPATQMQPAYDLKTITAYRTNVATVSEGVEKEQFNGRECAVVRSNGPVTIQWPVQIGVADIYSITVKYYYPADTVRGRVQLIGPGNTLMTEQPIHFTNTKPGKWNSFTFNSGSMINAGNYTVKLIIENAEKLAVSGIDVQ